MSGLIPDELKVVLERNARALQLRPAIGKGVGKTCVRLRPGLKCEIEDGPWKLTAGVSENSGGTNAGPDPGTFGRGALGSCLAMNYANWAAKLEVPVEAIEVEVEGEYDARGYYGLADVPPVPGSALPGKNRKRRASGGHLEGAGLGRRALPMV